MVQFAARRFLWMLLVLFVVSFVTFIMMHQIPGGPFTREKKLDERVLANLEKKYHLDDPLHIQYADYLYDVTIPRITTKVMPPSILEDYLINIKLPGSESTYFRWMNFGPSFNSRTETVNDIFEAQLPVSAQLGAAAMLVAVSIGVPLGILAALKQNTVFDYAGMSVAILGVSVPVIIMGPVLKYVFAVELGWLPSQGWGEWKHFIMPAFALGFAQSALMARLTRATLLQVLTEDYIRTARAKGLRENTIVMTHALKNAMIPVVTVMGPLFAALVTGTFVTERIFGIPGIGDNFVTSIGNRDYPVIMGTVLLFAMFLVLSNFFVDIAYAWLDPRIRLN